MRLFFLGVAAGVLAGREGNRTMMIHPSHLTSMHDIYANWARSVKHSWKTALDDDGSPDQADLRKDFEASYVELSVTADLPSFEALWTELSYALEDTMIKVVNANGGRIPKFPWSDSYAFILIGGAGLDRGFTVEGLTTTYMPRGAGTGTADTIQQRARFFGYKRNYVGLLRIFVDTDVSDAFTAYVEHEKSVRGALKAHGDKPLSLWRRLFFLDNSLRPTRSSVMALETMRGRAKEWVWGHTLGEAQLNNAEPIDAFLTRIADQIVVDPDALEHNWTGPQRHMLAAGLPLATVYADLLVPLSFEDDDDVFDHTLMLLQLRAALDDHDDSKPPLLVDLYKMSSGASRERAVKKNGAIENIFQGANPASAYPGDRELRRSDRFTVQIHTVQPKSPAGAIEVQIVAVNVPLKYRRDGVYQPPV